MSELLLSPDVAEFIQMVGFSCYEGYGLTETSPLVAANGWSGPGKSRLQTVGLVANGVEANSSIPMLGTTQTDQMKEKSLFTDLTS